MGFCRWLPLEEFFSTSKQLAGATCVISMLAIIWMFDSPRRRALMVLLIALGVSALINETIKQVTGRFRPGDSVLLDEEDMADRLEYIAAHPGTPVTAERMDQWLLFKKNRPWFDSDFASFPSGHANTAFVLAAFLLVLYPRGRAGFWLGGSISDSEVRWVPCGYRAHVPRTGRRGG